jgi:diketogulonate reductase-like aldo/keto reductase
MRRSRSPTTNQQQQEQPHKNSASSQNSFQLPKCGLGTFRLKGSKCSEAVSAALDLGVTLIDSAESYKNAQDFAKTLHEKAKANPETIFTVITKISKESLSDKGGSKVGVEKAIKEQRKLLKLDDQQKNIRLVALLHWPGCANGNTKSPKHKIARLEGYRALLDEKKAGRVDVVGVSNFTVDHLKELFVDGDLPPPEINQIECHPYCQQKDLRKFCKEHGIVVQAYTSLGRSVEGPRCLYGNWEPTYPKLVKDDLIVDLAKKMKVTPELLLLRWAVAQKEFPLFVIPKTSTKEHIEENQKCVDEEFWKTKNAMLPFCWVSKINQEIKIPEGFGEEICYAYPKEKVPI